MPKFETNQIDLNNNGRVILYQRPDVKNPKWQCRISVAGSTGYKIISTRETDQSKAERIALAKYEKLYFKVRRCGFLKGRPFNVVVTQRKPWGYPRIVVWGRVSINDEDVENRSGGPDDC